MEAVEASESPEDPEVKTPDRGAVFLGNMAGDAAGHLGTSHRPGQINPGGITRGRFQDFRQCARVHRVRVLVGDLVADFDPLG